MSSRIARFHHRPGLLHRRLRDAIALLAVALALALATPARSQSRAPAQALVPAQWNHRTDAMGFRWDIDQNGMVNDGQNDCFDGGLMLMVNGQQFSASSSMMTPDGSEYVLSNTLGAFQVTRRIRVDTTLGVARYVEMITNTGSAVATVPVQIRTQVGGQYQTLVSDSGAVNPTTLGKKESGLVLFQQPNNSRPSVFFVLASGNSPIKPTIQAQNNIQLLFDYPVSVPAGKTVSIMHVVGQRQFPGVPDPKAIDALFKPLRAPAFTRDLPTEVRRTIVNWRSSGWTGGEGGGVPTIEAALGIEPGPSDVLAIGEGTRIKGNAAAEALSVQTRFGGRDMDLADVAAIAGPRAPGGQTRVFLRDGQVFSGTAELRGLTLKTDSGIEVSLEPQTLDRLVLRVRPGDGRAAGDAYAYLETFGGDRLALAGDGEQKIAAATPWGTVEVALADIREMRAAEGKPGHELRLKDGSRLFAYIGDAAIEVETRSFGPQRLSLPEVRAIWAVGPAPAEGEEQRIEQPHAILAGGYVLVGPVVAEQIQLRIEGQTIAMAPDQTRVLRKVEDGDADDPTQPATFEAELWAGGTAIGTLAEPSLPVRLAGGVCHVPQSDIVEVVMPRPTLPDETHDKIARLVRELGDESWETREAATRALAELGPLVKGPLEESLNVATDPEVRRRLQDIVDGIEP